MSRLLIDPSERIDITGKTGSGKTEWTKYMLRIISRTMPVVIIDIKGLWLGKGKGRPEDWEKDKKKPGTIDLPHLMTDSYNPKWNVQCLQPEDGDDPRLAQLAKDLFKMGGNVFVDVDETEGLATASYVPEYLRKIWKMGRAYNIGAWAGSQVPNGIPKIFKSQAEQFVTFKVGDEDVEDVAKLLHATEEEVSGLSKYEWLHYNSNEDEYAAWHEPIPFEEKKTP